VGIILNNFAQLSSESGDGGSATMTKAQKMWVKTQQKLQSASEPKKAEYYPPDENRTMVYKVVETETFEWGIMAVIVANAVVMACERYDASDELRSTLNGLGIFFAAVFVLEAAAKMYAMVRIGPFPNSKTVYSPSLSTYCDYVHHTRTARPDYAYCLLRPQYEVHAYSDSRLTRFLNNRSTRRFTFPTAGTCSTFSASAPRSSV
jgi:hypothetical protein